METSLGTKTNLDLYYQRWGVNSPRPEQKEIINQILAAEDSSLDETSYFKKRIVVLPTGYGKTLCFGVPVALLQGITLIIFPLRALLFDQEERFKKAGLNPLILVGGQSRQCNQDIIDRLSTGHSKVLLSTPEMLLNQSILNRLKHLVFSHLVIDEAHVVHQWGNSFRQSYSQLSQLWQKLDIRQISAFTATADTEIIKTLRTLLGGSDIYEFVISPNKPNIFYKVWRSEQSEYLIKFLLSRRDLLARPAIIFLRNRKGCEFFAHNLHFIETKSDVRFYHAGLSHAEKEHVAHWFKYSKHGVLVSTNAYGMGVDHPGIRTVVHWGIPDSMVSYVQETGRAGRDGRPADAILIYSKDEKDSRSEFYNFLNSKKCRRQSLLAHFNQILEGPCQCCDMCSSSGNLVDPLYDKIIALLSRENRMHKEWDLAKALSTTRSFRAFNQRDLTHIIENAIALTLVKRSRNPLSWNRICIVPKK